jgi:hypothetical protein
LISLKSLSEKKLLVTQEVEITQRDFFPEAFLLHAFQEAQKVQLWFRGRGS